MHQRVSKDTKIGKSMCVCVWAKILPILKSKLNKNLIALIILHVGWLSFYFMIGRQEPGFFVHVLMKYLVPIFKIWKLF